MLRDTARTISAIPPYCALWGFWCLNMANWVRYPLPLSERFSPWSTCEVEVRYPPSKGVCQRYFRDTLWKQANGCDIPLCDTISKGYCPIWGGISHWAAKFQPWIRADLREGGEDSNFSVFRVRRFTEWPGALHWIAFPVEILTKPLIHWVASPVLT